jgi:hypothetical protein
MAAFLNGRLTLTVTVIIVSVAARAVLAGGGRPQIAARKLFDLASATIAGWGVCDA